MMIYKKIVAILLLTTFFTLDTTILALAQSYSVYQNNNDNDLVLAYTISDFNWLSENPTKVDFITKGRNLDQQGVDLSNDNIYDDCLTISAPVGFEISMEGLKNSSTYMLKYNGNNTFVAVETDIINNGNITLQWETNLEECFQLFLQQYEPERVFIDDNHREEYKNSMSFEIATTFPYKYGMTEGSFVRFNKAGRYVFHGNKFITQNPQFSTAVVVEIYDDDGFVPDTSMDLIKIPPITVNLAEENKEDVEYIEETEETKVIEKTLENVVEEKVNIIENKLETNVVLETKLKINSNLPTYKPYNDTSKYRTIFNKQSSIF